jgi:hypothetical protein
MNILVEAVRIFEGVATSVADQAQDGLGLYRGLDGTTAADTVTNWTAIARSLGDFLSTLHRVDPTGGPEPGPHTAAPATCTTKHCAPWGIVSSASSTAAYAIKLTTTNTKPGHTAQQQPLDT